jgi:hypothetical protein
MPKTTDYLRLQAFRATPLVREPFQHLIVPGFISPEGLAAINADYPRISSSGSFPVDQVSFGAQFQNLLDELESDDFRAAFEEKFSLDLAGRPTVTTVRGRCDSSDGRIHTDSTSKIITVLIYMNESWDQPGGRLRLLRSANNLNDIIVEVPPIAGTMLAFNHRCRNLGIPFLSSDDGRTRHGHDELAATAAVLRLLGHDLVLEVPWQDENVVRLFRQHSLRGRDR